MSLLDIRSVSKSYPSPSGNVQALCDLTFQIQEGESLAIVGESGSGKSTLAKLITCLEQPDDGALFFNQEQILPHSAAHRRHLYQQLQMIFQNASASFDPRKTIGASIQEVLHNFRQSRNVSALLTLTGLPTGYARRYPHQLSGGECQRAAIARALAAQPKLLLCDEITSSLDVSVQAQLIRLLLELKQTQHLTYLLISHDLAVVQLLCEQTMVLYQGHMVEYGPTDVLLHTPAHPYTQLLVASAFSTSIPPEELLQSGDGKNSCCFAPRCCRCRQACFSHVPLLQEHAPGHFCACSQAVHL